MAVPFPVEPFKVDFGDDEEASGLPLSAEAEVVCKFKQYA